MFDALGRVLNDIALGPQARKVRQYLDDATTDSVLEDLKKALAPRLREISGLWTTFDACCVKDSAQERYWTADSFKRHIETKYPYVTISEDIVQLLWKSFHFYAYHPFPQNTTDGRVDSAAFQRAIALLAVRGTDILGSQDGGDYCWRDDDASFHRADIARIFRSISLPNDEIKQSTELDHEPNGSLSDAMDVLAMTQPHSVTLAPSPDQLRPAAQKLLDDIFTQRRYEVARKDLLTLLSLLLRLRLGKTRWGSGFYFGVLDRADPADLELADALVDALVGGPVEEVLESKQVLKAMDLLPNFHVRFHQLWAVLFQPPMNADDELPGRAPAARQSHILETISLFVPQPVVSRLSKTTTQDTRITFEKSSQSSQRPNDMTLTSLIRSLAYDPHPHVLVLSAEGTASTPATVMGAYFPGPLWVKSDGSDERRESKTGTSHLLFQLQPRFRLFGWTRPHAPLKNLITTNDDAPSLEAIAGSDETFPKYNKSYDIGAAGGEKGVCLHIDPETNSATLRSATSDSDSGEAAAWYRDMCSDYSSFDKTLDKKQWEVDLQVDHFDVFRVSGGITIDLPTSYLTRPTDKAQYARQATEFKIDNEELKRRIQGFGSTD